MIQIYRAVFVLALFFISYGAFTPTESSQSILYLDKVVHFLAFLILTFLLDISLSPEQMQKLKDERENREFIAHAKRKANRDRVYDPSILKKLTYHE